jgi:hypothetical protein
MTDLIEMLKNGREKCLDLIEQAYCNRMTERRYEAVRQEVKDIFNNLWIELSTNSQEETKEVKQ